MIKWTLISLIVWIACIWTLYYAYQKSPSSESSSKNIKIVYECNERRNPFVLLIKSGKKNI